jgi:hypothetical protein
MHFRGSKALRLCWICLRGQGRQGIRNKTVGTISRKTSDSTDKFNGQNLLDIAVTNALEILRGQNFEN